MDQPQEQALFDSREYTTELRYILPEILGKKPNEFVNAARWIVMELDSAEAYYPEEDECEIVSPEYAENSDFDEQFANWQPTRTSSTVIECYLAGFPRLTLPDGSYVDCLHYWSQNSDINAETLAVPLGSIRGLAIYSKIRTRLQMDWEEQNMGERSAFEVPLLRDKKSGEMVCRAATTDDIKRVIEAMDESPQYVHGIGRPSTITNTRYVYPEEAKNLLAQ